MYHYMKTVHAGDTRNRLIQGIAGLCVRYYRFPDDEVVRQIKLGKSRASAIESQKLRPICDQFIHLKRTSLK